MNTPQDWDPRICNERSGFLFQHECDQLPEAHCSQCSRPVCESHTHYVDNEPFCTTCAKQDAKSQRKEAGRRQRTRHHDHYDDPYFYGDTYYHNYGRYRPGYWGFAHYSSYHSHDFTSGDAESVMYEGDGDFETDMSES